MPPVHPMFYQKHKHTCTHITLQAGEEKCLIDPSYYFNMWRATESTLPHDRAETRKKGRREKGGWWRKTKEYNRKTMENISFVKNTRRHSFVFASVTSERGRKTHAYILINICFVTCSAYHHKMTANHPATTTKRA